MQTKAALKSLILIGFSLISGFASASDTAKEKRWADQIVDSIMVGDAEWLAVGNSKILGIYTEYTSEKALGGAIVLHGSGVHPNWDQIIRPLRSQLPDFGWSTLSIQMPVLANDAEYEAYAPLFTEVAPRIDAAVKFLKAKGIKNIVLVAHSLGSTMSAYYLSTKPDAGIKAFVGIGMPGTMADDEKMNNTISLKKVSISVLDIYGSNDNKSVMEGAKGKKQAAAKAGNKNYTQVMVAGADHFFNNKDDELIKRVRGWLTNNAK